VIVNNFFVLGSGIYLTLSYGILLDFEVVKRLLIISRSFLELIKSKN